MYHRSLLPTPPQKKRRKDGRGREEGLLFSANKAAGSARLAHALSADDVCALHLITQLVVPPLFGLVGSVRFGSVGGWSKEEEKEGWEMELAFCGRLLRENYRLLPRFCLRLASKSEATIVYCILVCSTI